MKANTPAPLPSSMKKISKKKQILLVLLVIAIVCVAIGVYILLKEPEAAQAPLQLQESKAVTNKDEAGKKRVRLIATGDMIPHDAINKAAKQADGTYNYYPMFGDMKKFFDESDVRFCNQAVLGGGTQYGITGYPKFNAPTEFSRDMAKLGCNVINTGSNHVNDFNQEVISSSVDAWKSLPGMLAVAGANSKPADQQKVRYFEVKGVKFAFVSYTTYSNEPSPNGWSVTMYSDTLAKQQLAEARQKADIVIASLRWGTEYSPNINNAQKSLAPKLANFGADVVLGHGPHVLQPAETIKLDDGRNAYIWYSLGNFFNAQLDLPTLFNGIAVMDIDPETKKIDSLEYLPIYMHYEWNAADKAAGKLLTRRNFSMYTFADGQAALNKSVNNTTFAEQKQRISNTLNNLTKVKLLTKNDYLQS